MKEETRSILMRMNIPEDIKRDIITEIENSLLNKEFLYDEGFYYGMIGTLFIMKHISLEDYKILLEEF